MHIDDDDDDDDEFKFNNTSTHEGHLHHGILIWFHSKTKIMITCQVWRKIKKWKNFNNQLVILY